MSVLIQIHEYTVLVYCENFLKDVKLRRQCFCALISVKSHKAHRVKIEPLQQPLSMKYQT